MLLYPSCFWGISEPDDQISGIVMKMKEIISRDPKQGQALIEGLEKLLDAVMMEYED